MSKNTIKNYLKKDGITYKAINANGIKGVLVSVDTRKVVSAVKENAPRIRKFVAKVANAVATR